MEQLFLFLALIIIISSLMTIISINPIHSVFWLVFVFINSSALLIVLGFEFIPLMLIIIYVGAIAILFLFVIMMLDLIQLRKINIINHVIPIVIINITHLILQVLWLVEDISILNFSVPTYKEWSLLNLNHITQIGLLLYDENGLLFIILSFLLLIAMIGAILLTLELGINTKRQHLSNQHHRNNSWT